MSIENQILQEPFALTHSLSASLNSVAPIPEKEGSHPEVKGQTDKAESTSIPISCPSASDTIDTQQSASSSLSPSKVPCASVNATNPDLASLTNLYTSRRASLSNQSMEQNIPVLESADSHTPSLTYSVPVGHGQSVSKDPLPLPSTSTTFATSAEHLGSDSASTFGPNARTSSTIVNVDMGDIGIGISLEPLDGGSARDADSGSGIWHRPPTPFPGRTGASPNPMGTSTDILGLPRFRSRSRSSSPPTPKIMGTLPLRTLFSSSGSKGAILKENVRFGPARHSDSLPDSNCETHRHPLYSTRHTPFDSSFGFPYENPRQDGPDELSNPSVFTRDRTHRHFQSDRPAFNTERMWQSSNNRTVLPPPFRCGMGSSLRSEVITRRPPLMTVELGQGATGTTSDWMTSERVIVRRRSSPTISMRTATILRPPSPPPSPIFARPRLIPPLRPILRNSLRPPVPGRMDGAHALQIGFHEGRFDIDRIELGDLDDLEVGPMRSLEDLFEGPEGDDSDRQYARILELLMRMESRTGRSTGNSSSSLNGGMAEPDLASYLLSNGFENQVCVICMDERLATKTDCCKTPVCLECMRAYVRGRVREGLYRLPCPSAAPPVGQCRKFLQRSSILAFLDAPLRQRYHTLLIEANHEPYIRTCPMCSKPRSLTREERALVDKHRGPVHKTGLKITCAECGSEWCYQCHVLYHQGITCKIFQRGEKLLKKWAHETDKTSGQRHAQKCPKCKFFIEKTTGCNHMECSRCHTEFCYLCGGRWLRAKWLGGHDTRFSILGCKYNLLPRFPFFRIALRSLILGGGITLAILIALVLVIVITLGIGVVIICLPGLGCYLLYAHCRDVVARRRTERQNRLERDRVHAIFANQATANSSSSSASSATALANSRTTTAAISTSAQAPAHAHLEEATEASPNALRSLPAQHAQIPTMNANPNPNQAGARVTLEIPPLEDLDRHMPMPVIDIDRLQAQEMHRVINMRHAHHGRANRVQNAWHRIRRPFVHLAMGIRNLFRR